MHILLVEPAYYTRYPPLGLLKLASYHRIRGGSVELIRGCSFPNEKPDKVELLCIVMFAELEVML